MPKYLWEVSYTTEGTKGLIRDGGTKRRAAVEKALAGVGGKLDAFYYAFGKYDLIGIADFPDNVSAAAFSLAVAATGAAVVRTTVLLSVSEIDAAAKKKFSYRAPGR
jgi:uncharacterized protein with GYD domain